MALTRKMLKAMGIEEEKIDQIIEAHSETVSALKDQRDEYKEKAEALEDTEKKLKEAEKKIGELEEGDGFEAKYTEEHKAFEAYKAEVQGKEAKAEKAKLYRELLAAEKIDAKRIETIMKVTDLDGITVEEGAIKDAEKLTESIRSEWADFIPTTGTNGAGVATPPAGGEGEKQPNSIAEALMQKYSK